MPKEQVQEISERILFLIKERGYSYGTLSEKTGISKAMLQRYSTGETGKIPISRLKILADALHTTPEYLLGWTDENPIKEYLEFTDEEISFIKLLRNADPLFKAEAIEMLKRHQK